MQHGLVHFEEKRGVIGTTIADPPEWMSWKCTVDIQLGESVDYDDDEI
jgi:hypothetical protein